MRRRLEFALALALIAGAANAAPRVLLVENDEPDAPPCAPYAAMSNELAKQFGETPTGVGTSGGATAIMLLTAPDGKTFTLRAIGNNGVACLIGAGEHWQAAR